MSRFSGKTVQQLEAEARAAWDSADVLDEILQILNQDLEGRRLKGEIQARLNVLRTLGNPQSNSRQAIGAAKRVASTEATAKPTGPMRASREVALQKAEVANQALKRLKPITVRDYCVVEASGMNSVSLYCPEHGSAETEVILPSSLPNIPSCIILPALPRDPIVAGDSALRHHQGIGESWPPDAFIRFAQTTATSVPDRRLLLCRCWDLLCHAPSTIPKEGEGSQESSNRAPVFEWNRVDDAGGPGLLSASDAIAEEIYAVTCRYEKKTLGHLIVLIPDWLDDLSQQSLLNSLSHRIGVASSSVRLLWRSVAYALQWLDSLSDDQVPAVLYLLEAQPSGLVLRQFAVREFTVEGKRVLCPVRRAERVSPHDLDSTQGLLQLAAGSYTSGDAAMALRDLYLGRVAFFETTESIPSDRAELESVPSQSGLLFRVTPQPRPPQLGKWENQIDKVASQIPKDATLLVFGVLAKAVSQALTVRGIPHTSLAPEQGVQGGSIFMQRARKGWPTYLDELPGLDLFVLKSRHRHWEPLIPEGTEVFGQEQYVYTLLSCASVGRGNKALNTYLRRQGSTCLRFLKTTLPEPPQDDEPCDLRVTASSAGGLAVIEAIPTSNRGLFGQSDTLKLDWESMYESLPEADGWPKVEYKHGYPKCGEIFSSQKLFDNLLSQLRELSVLCARRNWRSADDEIGRMLIGSARGSTPIGSARQEIQQMAPIGTLRPAGTRVPANFLDTSLPVERCIYAAAPHQHNGMKQVVSELLDVYNDLAAVSSKGNYEVPQIGDRLFKLLTWLGGYFPEELLPRLRKITKDNPNSENLTALGRCGRSPEDATLLLKLLVADKLCYRAEGKGTANYLKCFIYLAFQHEGVLQDCDRDQVRILFEHAIYILENETESGNFKISFVNALRTIALALRYRQHITSGPQFLLCEANELTRIKNRGTGLFGNSEVELAQRAMDALDAALIALESKARLNRRRDGAYRAADDRKMKLVIRVKEWLEWKAPTDIWIGGLDDDDDGD